MWRFIYRHVGTQRDLVLEFPDWAGAYAGMRDFIAALRPRSLASLQNACENFPKDKPVSITDGENYFWIQNGV